MLCLISQVLCCDCSLGAWGLLTSTISLFPIYLGFLKYSYFFLIWLSGFSIARVWNITHNCSVFPPSSLAACAWAAFLILLKFCLLSPTVTPCLSSPHLPPCCFIYSFCWSGCSRSCLQKGTQKVEFSTSWKISQCALVSINYHITQPRITFENQVSTEQWHLSGWSVMCFLDCLNWCRRTQPTAGSIIP